MYFGVKIYIYFHILLLFEKIYVFRIMNMFIYFLVISDMKMIQLKELYIKALITTKEE